MRTGHRETGNPSELFAYDSKCLGAAHPEATMTPPSLMLPNTQIKRGLFNFVGEIGATLFGTATEDRVAQLKHHITKAQRTNRRIVHATNELISVVNQTRAEVSLNCQHLVAVEQFAKELYAELVTYRAVLDGFVGSLIALEESTQIDRILSALESVLNLWLRESDRSQCQRASLELGQLTEEILPPNELMLILENSQGVGLFLLGLAWYYQHVSLVPVWEETRRLVFTAQLPLMDKIRYALYRIRLWLVHVDGSGHTLQLQTPKMSPLIHNVAEYLNLTTVQATSRPSVVRVPFTAGVAFSAPEVS